MVKNDLAHGKRPFARKYQQETMPTEKLSYALPLDMPGLPQERKRLWQTGKNRIARKGLVRSQPDGDFQPPGRRTGVRRLHPRNHPPPHPPPEAAR